MTTHEAMTSSGETRITDELVHRICPYLRQSLDCQKCPRTVESPYGPGTQGCFALAEEVIEIVSRELAATRREGWVMVPRIPTPEMVEAGYNAPCDLEDPRLEAIGIYRAMLSAVEKP